MHSIGADMTCYPVQCSQYSHSYYAVTHCWLCLTGAGHFFSAKKAYFLLMVCKHLWPKEEDVFTNSLLEISLSLSLSSHSPAEIQNCSVYSSLLHVPVVVSLYRFKIGKYCVK